MNQKISFKLLRQRQFGARLEHHLPHVALVHVQEVEVAIHVQHELDDVLSLQSSTDQQHCESYAKEQAAGDDERRLGVLENGF